MNGKRLKLFVSPGFDAIIHGALVTVSCQSKELQLAKCHLKTGMFIIGCHICTLYVVSTCHRPTSTTARLRLLSCSVGYILLIICCDLDSRRHQMYTPDPTTVQYTIRGVATGGISGYIPPKSVYLKFFMWLFCLLDPGQIRCRAIYTPQIKFLATPLYTMPAKSEL